MAETSFLDVEAYGFDDEDANGKDDAPLSWRLDGSDSLSDWAIVVKRMSAEIESGESIGAATYHVHKNVLAVGPRRSECFVKLFKNGHDVSEMASSTSTIELEESAADAFPNMLDYIYSHKEGDGKDLGITTKNAVTLRHLAQYFRINSLFRAVTEFIGQDLVPRTASTYLSEGVVYGDEKLAKAAEDMCAQNMEEIDEESFNGLAPELMKRIFSSEKMKCTSRALSKIVSTYCDARHGVIDADLFRIMTDEKVLPRIEPDTALPLLKTLISVSAEAFDTPSIDSAAASSMKARCIAALLESWREKIARPLEEAENEATNDASPCKKKPKLAHRDLPMSVQVEIFESTLKVAKCDVDEKEDEVNTRIKEIQRHNMEGENLRADVARLEKEVFGLIEKATRIARMEKAYRAEVARLNNEIVALREKENEYIRCANVERYLRAENARLNNEVALLTQNESETRRKEKQLRAEVAQLKKKKPGRKRGSDQFATLLNY